MHVHVNETQLYFEVVGSALGISGTTLRSRPTLVVLHGGPGFDHGYLRPGLDPLGEVAQVVYIDLRGQGRSGRPSIESCTLEQMADDVAELFRILGLERPVVFGHSAGGFVGLHLALRHPSALGGLVLCDTTPTLGHMVADGGPPGLTERGGPDAIAAAERLFGGDWSAESFDAFDRLVWPLYAAPGHEDLPRRLMSLSLIRPEIVQHFFRLLAPQYDVRDRLRDIGVPTLVLVGSHDWVCPPAASRLLAASIPSARLIELGHSGHFCFSEQPAEFTAALTSWLYERERGAGLPVGDYGVPGVAAAGVAL
jgi:proline iminopeptidase